MKIRLATISDTEKIFHTHKKSIEELCKNNYSPEDITNWTNILAPKIYESAIKEKIMIVAEEENKILGLGILDIKNTELSAIYIHPEHTGKGIGKKILLELEKVAIDNGTKHLKLGSTINALGFYKHHDYIEKGRCFHELPNGVKLECIEMYKELSS